MKKFLTIALLLIFTLIGFAQEKAIVYLLRPFDFGAAMGAAYGGKKYWSFKHYIDIDGKQFGNVPSLSYYKIELNPGSYTFSGFVGTDSYEDTKVNPKGTYLASVSVSAGQKYYLRIDEKKYKIGLISEKEFKKECEKKNPIQYVGTAAFVNGEYYINGKPVDQAIQQSQDIPQIAQTPDIEKETVKVTKTSDVDQNIPITNTKADNTFVLIIANEEYQFLDNVNYAAHDGEVFKEYCIKTLGVPEKQIRYCPNASYGIKSGGVDWLKYALDNFDGSRGIVYYCGHGIPDEKTAEAYIIPVDGKGTNTTTCYSLNQLYKTLANTKADNITYFMDACFTGANKEGSMLVAARGVAREPKKESLSGKSVVFSASSSDETAMTYDEKGHGLFTYYLLKKLQESNGDVSYDELSSFISKNVKKDAFLLNEKPQNPVVATSPAAKESWRNMKLK